MPKFIISRTRIMVPLMLAGFIALMCAGPGTIILLALPRLSPESELEVRSLIAGGRKIDAIKRVRDLKRVSLEAAKDYVESLPGTSMTGER